MKRPRKGRAVGALVLAGALAASACGSSSSTSGSGTGTSSGPLDSATLAKVQQTVRTFQETNRSPGVLVGIWSPKGTFVSATGVADLATGMPLTIDMQYKIASQTKAFTGNLVLQLVGQGKVSLDDHISKWVTGVPNGDQITVRQLLNMTSGLNIGFLAEEANVAKLATGNCAVPQDSLAAGASQPPVAPPGAKWFYSNYGYDLLGRIVEVVTGQDVGTVMQQRILGPLGLHRTSLPLSGNGLSEPFARGYVASGPNATTQTPVTASDDATALATSCVWASGAMVSTLSDIHLWSQALGSGALLKPAVWTQAQQNMIPFNFPDHYLGPGRWSQGLGFIETGGFIGKDGSIPGYEPFAMYSPSRHTTIAVVSTKQGIAITPPVMAQALAMDLYGPNIGFGLTPAQALTPSFTGGAPED